MHALSGKAPHRCQHGVPALTLRAGHEACAREASLLSEHALPWPRWPSSRHAFSQSLPLRTCTAMKVPGRVSRRAAGR